MATISNINATGEKLLIVVEMGPRCLLLIGTLIPISVQSIPITFAIKVRCECTKTAQQKTYMDVPPPAPPCYTHDNITMTMFGLYQSFIGEWKGPLGTRIELNDMEQLLDFKVRGTPQQRKMIKFGVLRFDHHCGAGEPICHQFVYPKPPKDMADSIIGWIFEMGDIDLNALPWNYFPCDNYRFGADYKAAGTPGGIRG